MTTKRSGSPYDLCNFVFADGRGCCMPSIPSLNGYCRSHGTTLKPRPAAEHNEDLLQEIGLFDEDPPSEDEVHRAMSRVFRALAANRISTRRTATFGYLAQIILTSKGSKQARQESNNLSHALLKTLDLAYNPKYGKLNPAFKEAASRFAQDQPQPPPPIPPPSLPSPSTTAPDIRRRLSVLSLSKGSAPDPPMPFPPSDSASSLRSDLCALSVSAVSPSSLCLFSCWLSTVDCRLSPSPNPNHSRTYEPPGRGIYRSPGQTTRPYELSPGLSRPPSTLHRPPTILMARPDGCIIRT
jgi:hypothetical protein